MIEDCAGSPATTAAADRVGGVFFTSKTVKGIAFGFNLMHHAHVLHHGGCVSLLARNYFAT